MKAKLAALDKILATPGLTSSERHKALAVRGKLRALATYYSKLKAL